LSIVGAGNFAQGVLLPALRKQGGAHLRGVVTATGLSARSAAEKFGFSYCGTAAQDIWADVDTAAVVIATRHDAHAALVASALEAGKAVFVEKPLCLSEAELDTLVDLVRRLEVQGRNPFAMVGFNRRFAPAVQQLRSFFEKTSGSVNVLYRVNAGRVPPTSWVASAEEGGGRIVGEVCHFVDLCAFLAGDIITEVSAARSTADQDEVVVTLKMSRGSIATVAYLVDGDRAASKERIEVFGSGAIGTIDDFRRATLSSGGRTRRLGSRFGGQDKGHAAEMGAFVRAVADGSPSPVPFVAAVNSTRATFAVLRSLESGAPVRIL
jgi:polar amino acid transport system substrate-binding protein